MGNSTTSNDDTGPYGAGCWAFTTNLRWVNCPTNFWPDLPEKYDGTIDPEEFLQIYTTAIQAAEEAPKSWQTTSTSPSGARTARG